MWRGRFWIPCLGLGLLGAAACSLAIGKADLSAVHCEEEGHEGSPTCDDGQICLQGVCTDCAVAGICGGGGGTGGVGGEGGTGGGVGGTGGDEAGPDVTQGGSSGTGGVTHDSGTGGTVQDVGPEIEPDVPTPPDAPEDKPKPLGVVGDSCVGPEECATNRCVLDVGPLSGSACTVQCCSSTQCPPEFVCGPHGAENLCLAASRVGFSKPGAKVLGETCTDASTCRSLKCNTTGGVNQCTDVCCLNKDCGTNACGYSGTTNVWLCSSVAAANGDTASCSASSGCDSLYCSGSGKCNGSCCRDTDCGGTRICEYVLTAAWEAVRMCQTIPTAADPPCCTDADCPGKHCVAVDQDFVVTTRTVLRCQ